MHNDSHNLELTVTIEDDGKEFSISKTGSVVVKLAANPSTGYTWEPTEDPKPLELLTSEYSKADTPERVGAPRQQILTFGAIGPGVSKLKLGYRRPWEKDAAPVKTFGVKVNIQ